MTFLDGFRQGFRQGRRLGRHLSRRRKLTLFLRALLTAIAGGTFCGNCHHLLSPSPIGRIPDRCPGCEAILVRWPWRS